jgi:prefoldin alpha subunit
MSSPEVSPPNTINLDEMSLEELNQLKQQEENRFSNLMTRFQQFRGAAARLNASMSAVSEITPASEGKEVLVPLTESVYVPGKLRDPNKFLVELGTGFYAEKSSKETKGFLERKLKIVDANSENLTKAISATRQNIEQVSMAMQGKMLEIRAKQEGRRLQAAGEN